MEKICLKITLMIAVVTLLLLPVTRILRSAYQKSLDEPVFRFPKETTILVAGDSHMETAVDPTFLPHSESVSCSAENYFYTYYKLRLFLAKNLQISKVVLGFSWHNFPKKYQESFLFGEIPSKIDQYFLLLDSDGRELISTTQSSYLVPWLRYRGGLPLQIYNDQIAYKELGRHKLSRGNYTFFGGHLASLRSNVARARIREKVGLYFFDHNAPSPPSAIMTRYLFKILELCRAHGISVVLVNAPVHEEYRRAVPPQVLAAFEQIRASIMASYPSVRYLDYSSLPLPTDYFSDGDHVNQKGSEIVTKMINGECRGLSSEAATSPGRTCLR